MLRTRTNKQQQITSHDEWIMDPFPLFSCVSRSKAVVNMDPVSVADWALFSRLTGNQQLSACHAVITTCGNLCFFAGRLAKKAQGWQTELGLSTALSAPPIRIDCGLARPTVQKKKKKKKKKLHESLCLLTSSGMSSPKGGFKKELLFFRIFF